LGLTEALGLGQHEVVALVGGGGKTATMYGLCREAAAAGRWAVASGTARFTPPADHLDAPLLVEANEEHLIELIQARLADRTWLIAATGHGSKGRLFPLSLDAVARLDRLPGLALLALEADGSAMRPFKAPAEHEPSVPACTTMLVAVVGADVFGRTLDENSVHRLERVAFLTGAREGEPVTPEIVARVLAHDEGGRKGLPAGARYRVVINKVSEARRERAEEAARLLLERGVERVVLAQAREPEPVVAVISA
jgi:molybdenum cofactor cytidylyltransferase